MSGNNEEYVNQIIDPKAFDQIRIAVKEMALLDQEFIDTAKSIDIMNTALAKSSSFKELNNSAAKMAIEQEKLNQAVIRTELLNQKKAAAEAKGAAEFEKKVQREIAAIEKKAAKSVQMSEKERLAQIKLEMDTRKSFDSYEKGVKKKEAADKKNADQIAKNSRAYVVLSNTLEEQRKKAQDLAIIYGETSPRFLDAAKGVIELDTRLKAIDATLGKSQRNVGNYASGFNAMQSTFNQLTRELPALAVNAQTFFLAISNNLPQFFDAIKQSTDVLKEAKAAAVADAEAKGISAAATALAGGASEEAASQVGDFAKEQALAAAEGLKGPGIFKQLASSLFSVGTALSLGVTLLTLYGAEIVNMISEMFNGKDKVDELKLRLESLNKALDDSSYAEAIKNVAELTANIRLAKDGFLDKEKVLKQYNETIGKTTGEVKDLNTAEQDLKKNANAYVEMTLYKAAAQISLQEAANKAVEAAKAGLKQADEFRNGFDKYSDATAAVGAGPGARVDFTKVQADAKARNDKRKAAAIKELDDNRKQQEGIAKTFRDKAAAIAKQFSFDYFGGDFEEQSKENAKNTDAQDRVIQLVQFELDAQKQIAENEKSSFDDRMEAARNFNSASLRLAQLTAERDLSEEDITSSRKLTIKDKQNNDLIVADQEFAKLSDKIFSDQLTKEEKERAIAHQKELNAIKEEEALKLDLAEQAYANGTISEKQYGELTLRLQREFFQKYVNKEIQQAEELLRLSILTAEQRAEAEKNLADLKAKYSKEATSVQIADNKKLTDEERKKAKEREEIEKVLNDKKKELQKEIFELGVSIVNSAFENSKNKVQQEIEENERKSQIDIENVNNSVLSEEDKANKIAIIEAKTAAQNQVLELKKRDFARKQAQFEKAANIASITMSTYAAAAAALRPPPVGLGPLAGIPLAAITVGIGLARVAQVISTPIPYKDGTSSSIEGIALTDEAGPELYIPRTGKPYIGSNQPNLKKLQAGTKIIPHHKLVQMIGKPDREFNVNGTQIDILPLLHETKRGNDKLDKLYQALNKSKPAPPLSKTGLYETNRQSIRLMEWQKRNLS